MPTAVLSRRAERDLYAAIRWIKKDRPDAAKRLRKAVIAAAERIGTHPEIGIIRPEYADAPVRFLILTGFPYVIVYNAAFSPPRIQRVLHGARDIPALLGPSLLGPG